MCNIDKLKETKPQIVLKFREQRDLVNQIDVLVKKLDKSGLEMLWHTVLADYKELYSMVKFHVLETEEMLKSISLLTAIGKPVCGIRYACQGDLQFKCDGEWSQPEWNQKPFKLPGYVYMAESGKLYTFHSQLVTCGDCKKC